MQSETHQGNSPSWNRFSIWNKSGGPHLVHCSSWGKPSINGSFEAALSLLDSSLWFLSFKSWLFFFFFFFWWCLQDTEFPGPGIQSEIQQWQGQILNGWATRELYHCFIWTANGQGYILVAMPRFPGIFLHLDIFDLVQDVEGHQMTKSPCVTKLQRWSPRITLPSPPRTFLLEAYSQISRPAHTALSLRVEDSGIPFILGRSEALPTIWKYYSTVS